MLKFRNYDSVAGSTIASKSLSQEHEPDISKMLQRSWTVPQIRKAGSLYASCGGCCVFSSCCYCGQRIEDERAFSFECQTSLTCLSLCFPLGFSLSHLYCEFLLLVSLEFCSWDALTRFPFYKAILSLHSFLHSFIKYIYQVLYPMLRCLISLFPCSAT